MSFYFPKPKPLSPRSNVVIENGNYFIQYKNGRKKRVRGVPYSQSIYYLWFEYLKRSERYKKACAADGKGMKKLYTDFGNVFEHEGEQGFWRWWTERGERLFGVRTGFDAQRVEDWASLAEVKDLFESEQVTILVLPNDTAKLKLLKAVQKLIKDVPKSEPFRQEANYLPQSVKIDVESLRDCLTAYDLRQQGKSNLEIGVYFTPSASKAVGIFNDARKKGKADAAAAAEAEYLKSKKLTIEQYDALLDQDDSLEHERATQRTKLKNYLNMKASRMIRKAVDNIEAVERGVFPIGHKSAKAVADSQPPNVR